MKKGLCVYHANCNDGFAAALAVWLKYGDTWDYVPMLYGDALPPVHIFTNIGTMVGDDDTSCECYENIMIVDFSLPRKYMEELSKLTNLLVIDHHITSKEACEGLPFCIFDMNKSGCEMTWEYLFPDVELPELFKLISYRDLGKSFDESNSNDPRFYAAKKLHAGLGLFKREFEVWKKIMNSGVLNDVLYDGFIIQKYQEIEVISFVELWNKDKRFATIGGYRVPIANCSSINTISETIGALSNHYDFACGYFDTKDRRVFSLRTRRKDFDCEKIAKQYGGGGHRAAAGFSCLLENVDPTMDRNFFQRYSKFQQTK